MQWLPFHLLLTTALGGEETSPERDDAEGERHHARIQQRDEAVGRGDAPPGGGEEEARRHQDSRGPNAVVGENGQGTAHPRGVGEDLTDQGQCDQHAGMGVPRAEERLLEGRRGLAAAHDAQHKPPAVFDGHDRQQEHPGGAEGTLVGRLSDDPAVNTLQVGVAAWSLVHGLATLYLGGNLPPQLGDDPDQIARTIAAYLFRALP